MSHHLDTPLASQTGQLYIDDLYVFPGESSTVFIMDVNSNVNGLHSEPGFHPEARYEFKVHFDGADFEALTYRVSFGEADPGGRQALQLHTLTGAQARDDSTDGELVLEGQTGQTASAGGTRIWAGRIGDSFYIDLSLLAIVNGRWQTGPHRTCRHGGRRTRRTASPALTSTPSSSKSPTSTRSCDPAPAPACGAPPNSLPTRAAGGRSTALGTP